MRQFCRHTNNYINFQKHYLLCIANRLLSYLKPSLGVSGVSEQPGGHRRRSWQGQGTDRRGEGQGGRTHPQPGE